jgi:hypothetical protein
VVTEAERLWYTRLIQGLSSSTKQGVISLAPATTERCGVTTAADKPCRHKKPCPIRAHHFDHIREDLDQATALAARKIFSGSHGDRWDSYVYAWRLKGSQQQSIKIGVSEAKTGWWSRLVGMQAQVPEELEVLAVCPGQRWHEAEIHRLLRSARLWGECYLWTNKTRTVVSVLSELSGVGLKEATNAVMCVRKGLKRNDGSRSEAQQQRPTVPCYLGPHTVSILDKLRPLVEFGHCEDYVDRLVQFALAVLYEDRCSREGEWPFVRCLPGQLCSLISAEGSTPVELAALMPDWTEEDAVLTLSSLEDTGKVVFDQGVYRLTFLGLLYWAQNEERSPT